MSGFFGSISKESCVSDVFYGTDYHSHLGTKRAGMTFYSEEKGFLRAILNSSFYFPCQIMVPSLLFTVP